MADTITDYSTLVATNYRFYIPTAPYLSFFVQNIDLPTISLPPSEVGTPFTDLRLPGDHVDFSPLQVTFLVDQNLGGYLEMFHWIRGLGFPDTFEEYAELTANASYTSLSLETYKDIQVTTMTGQRNPNMQFTFKDAYPTNLTAPTLSATASGTQVVTCQASFTYTDFDIQTI